MKTYNAKKVVVSVLALAMGAGIAGSISGSIAWYQYSTRTTAQLQGVSAGTTRNLQLRIKQNGLGAEDGWLQDLSVEDLNAYLGISSTDDEKPDVLKLNPVTNQTTGNAKDAALTGFKGHPVYQYPTLPDAAQTIGTGEEKVWNYVTIPLQFRLVDNNGSGDKLVAKNVYLVDANFNDLRTGAALTNNADITPALRVHISNGTNNYLAANTAESTNVSGALDLNNNNLIDRQSFTGKDSDTEKIVNYGGADQNQTDPALVVPTAQESYKVSDLIANDNDAFHFTGGVSLGSTVATVDQGEQTYLEVNLVIWLEGWQTVADPASTASAALWKVKYSGSDFGLQFRFACEADK